MIDETGRAIVGILPLLICLVVVVGTPLLIVLLTRSSGRKRDEQLAAQWEQALDEAARGRGHLAFVRWVYQRARSGTGAKAFIVWYPASLGTRTPGSRAARRYGRAFGSWCRGVQDGARTIGNRTRST